MARLPVVGDDDGTWGSILNDFLQQAHENDGTLKANSVGTAQIQSGSVTNAKLAGPVVQSITAGAGINVDDTDPDNPVVSVTGGGTGTVASVNDVNPDGNGNVELTPSDIGAAADNHTHTAATITDPGFMSASDKTKLDGIASGATANSSDATLLNRANHTGTQAISTVTGLQDALDDKADTTHSHAIADVTNLQSSLNDKADTSHGHAISDVTGLQTALDGKASSSHSHTATDISDSTSIGRSVLTAANAAAARTAISAAAASHTHDIEDINATGTPSETTFLRGDGTWETPSAGNVLVLESEDEIPLGTPANTVIVRKSPV